MVPALALRALVRLTVLMGLDGVFLVVTRVTAGEEPSAAIGIGLLFFAAVAVVSGLWAILDGRRLGIPITIAVWVVVAVLLGVALPIVVGLVEGSDGSVVASDVAFFVPFIAALVVLPAALGGTIGHALRSQGAAG